MQDVLNTIRDFLISVNPLWIYLVISIIGLFVYWRGCTETRKDRSSIFDTFFVSISSGLIMARVSYLVINWSEYSKYVMSISPYERYDDGSIYLFRLMPWRLARIWDGGLTIFVAMVAFLLVSTVVVTLVKKWRLYQIFFPVFFSMITMLGSSFAYVGFMSETNSWLIIGSVLVLIPFIFWIVSKFLLVSIKNGVKRRKTLVYIGILLVTLTSMFVSYQYLLDKVSQFEFISVLTLILWTVVMDILVVLDINRPNVTIESVSSVRAVDIEINQPIRMK
jgi:hypothetical protein